MQNWYFSLIDILLQAYPQDKKPQLQYIKQKINQTEVSLRKIIQIVAKQTAKNPQDKIQKKLNLITQIGKNKQVKKKFSRAYYRCWITYIIEKQYAITDSDDYLDNRFKQAFMKIEQQTDYLNNLLLNIEGHLINTKKGNLINKLDKQSLINKIKTHEIYSEYQVLIKSKINQEKMSSNTRKNNSFVISTRKKSITKLNAIKQDPSIINKKFGFVQQPNSKIHKQSLKSERRSQLSNNSNLKYESFSEISQMKSQYINNSNLKNSSFSEISQMKSQLSNNSNQKYEISSQISSIKSQHQSSRLNERVQYDSFNENNSRTFGQTPTIQQKYIKIKFQQEKYPINAFKKQKKVALNLNQAYKEMREHILQIIDNKKYENQLQIQQEIKNYLNKQCSSGQYLKARNQMSQILRQFLKINVLDVFCQIIEVEKKILNQLFQQFKTLIEMQKLQQQKKAKSISADKFIEQAQFIIQSHPDSCYWVSFSGVIFFLVIFQTLCNSSKTDLLFDMLNNQHLRIDLAKKICEYGLAQNSLFDLLLLKCDIRNKSVLQALAEKAVQQKINLQSECPGTQKDTYIKLLIQKGLDRQKIANIIKEKGSVKTQSRFRKYLFDFFNQMTKEIRPLKISVTLEGQLYSLINSSQQYINQNLSDQDNSLTLNLTRFKMQCQWKGQDANQTGIIFSKGQLSAQKVVWKILDPVMGTSAMLSQEQSQLISKNINHSRKNEKYQAIEIKLKSINSKIKINPQNMKIKKIGEAQGSSIWQDSGILYWVPSYKIKNRVKQSSGLKKLFMQQKPQIQYQCQQRQQMTQSQNIGINENSQGFYHSNNQNPQSQNDNFSQDQDQKIKHKEQVKPPSAINVLQRRYKGFEFFQKQLAIPVDGQCHVDERDLVTSNQYNITYLDLFQQTYIYVKLSQVIYDKTQDKSYLKKQKQFSIELLNPIKRMLQYTNKRLNKNGSQFSITKNIQNYNQNQKHFKIKIQLNKKEPQFMDRYFHYLQYLAKKQNAKQIIEVQMSNEKSKIIESLVANNPQIEMKQNQNKEENLKMKSSIKRKKIFSLPQSQIKNLVDMDKQILEYNIIGIDVLARLLKDNCEIQKGLKIQKQDQQNIFKIEGASKKVAQFMSLFSDYAKKMQIQKTNQIVYKILQGKSPEYSIYQNVANFIPSFKVSKICDDLSISYKKSDQQKVIQAIQKFRIKWQQQQLQMIKKGKLQFQIRNVDPNILMIVYEKLNTYYGKKSENQKFNMFIQLKSHKKDSFFIALKNCPHPQNSQFESQIGNIIKRVYQLNKIRENLKNYHYIYLKQLQPFTKCKIEQKQNKCVTDARAKYKKQLKSQLEQISIKEEEKLFDNFCNFIRNDDACKFSTKFIDNPHQEMQRQIKERVKSLKFFENYLKQYLEILSEKCLQLSQIVMEPKIKKIYSQNILTHHLHKFQVFDIDFQNNIFNAEEFIRLIRCLQIDIKTHFKLQLPMIKHLQHFKEKLESCNVLIVKTGTGSGKSTILPAFMSCLGYRKILVTQPRRLACKTIYSRVRKVYGKNVVGFQISGQSQDTHCDLIYKTDGLFKQTLYANIVQDGKTIDLGKKALEEYEVIMLDEIHERSKNIDAIILYLSKMLDKNSKQKIILCSATVDNSIGDYFRGMKVQTFEVQVQRYKVQKYPIQNMSIIDKAVELSAQLKKDEQMLIFFPSVDQAVKAQKFFQFKKFKLAYVLHGAQQGKQQDEALKFGQIFCSTSIAETSLTFQNLKYVLDSRKSRIMKFNPDLQLYCTEQVYSSESSILQRIGRLGRTCQGQYYYLPYKNFDSSNKFELTQIQRIDLTNVLFQFMLKYKQFYTASSQLNRINTKQNQQFDKKLRYAKRKMTELDIIHNDSICSQLAKYGNLGSYSHNVALYLAQGKKCLHNMIAIISFFMFGRGIFTQLIKTIPYNKRCQSGDIQTISNYLMELSVKINLVAKLNLTCQEIRNEVQKTENILKNKKWLNTLVKVLNQMRKLYKKNSQLSESKKWSDILKILVSKPYQHYVYASTYMFGGSKRFFEKIIEDKVYKIGNRIQFADIHYSLEKNSLVTQFVNNDPPNFIFSMFANVSPLNECILAFNSIIPQGLVEKNMQIEVQLLQAQKMQGFDHQDQKSFFQSAKKYFYDCSLKNSKFQMRGRGKQLVGGLKKIDAQRRKNYQINLNATLDWYIAQRIKKQKNRPDLRRIDQNLLKNYFKTLNYKQIFLTLSYDLTNNYNSKLVFYYNGKMGLLNANTLACNRFIRKMKGFFTWYIQCQNIMKEDLKVPVRQPDAKKIQGGQQKLNKILKRVNEIVDPQVDWQTLRYMSNVQTKQRSLRVSRMIVVCWILCNQFDCTIKGGFIRDWVIRGDEYIPPGLDLTNLLTQQKIPRINDLITPSDIDLQMSSTKSFDQQQFKKLMEKAQITCQIDDDGWRKILVFDRHAPSGGFTADLIQPYTAICYDTYDFDVNIFYIKHNHLNQIGIKIPLILSKIDQSGRKEKQISLEQLINDTLEKKMRVIKTGIPDFRMEKFEDRKWKIDPAIYQSVVYQSNKTTSHIESLERFQKVYPGFSTALHKRILRVEHLVNHSWDSAYQAAKQWILRQHHTSNEKILFHGTKQDGMKGIKQNGFDSRYFYAGGNYGRGAYFADNPQKSDQYTESNENGQKYMFICQVALGNQQVLNQTDSGRLGPSRGYHSILGTGLNYREYIIQRWGQAVPIYLITYC